MENIKSGLKFYGVRIRSNLFVQNIISLVIVTFVGYCYTYVKVYNAHFMFLPILSTFYFFDRKKIYTLIPVVLIIQGYFGTSSLVDSLILIVIYFFMCELSSVLDLKKVGRSMYLVSITTFLFYTVKNILFESSFNTNIIIEILTISFLSYFITYLTIETYKYLAYLKRDQERCISEYLGFIILLSLGTLLTPLGTASFIIYYIIITNSFISDINMSLVSNVLIISFGYFTNTFEIKYAIIFLVVSIGISMLRKQGKFVIVVLFSIFQSVYYLYFAEIREPNYLIYTAIALGLFTITPTTLLEKFVPQITTSRDINMEKKQLQTRIRKQIFQLSVVFKSLGHAFTANHIVKERNNVSNVYNLICKNCERSSICFQKGNYIMYEIIDELIGNKINNEQRVKLLSRLRCNCDKYNRVYQVILNEIGLLKVEKEYQENLENTKKIVGKQLNEVAYLMEELSNDFEFYNDYSKYLKQEITSRLNAYKYEVVHLDVKKSNLLKIYLVISNVSKEEIEKVVFPIIKQTTKEKIYMNKVHMNNKGIYTIEFTSRLGYVLDIGIMTKPKNNSGLSGDNILRLELKNNRFLVALSDGMGSGKRAHHESRETLRLLGKMLKSGIREKSAIQTLNTIMSLRGTETFSTLDIALVNLDDGETQLIKEGAAPSFLVSGQNIKKYESRSLPIGVVNINQYNNQTLFMQQNDCLVLMSDGVYDQCPNTIEKILMNVKYSNAQEFAKQILEDVFANKIIDDDMSVIVIRCLHNRG